MATKKKNKLNVKNSLVNNINAHKKRGDSKPKAKSSVSSESYSDMQSGWGKGKAAKKGARKAAKKGARKAAKKGARKAAKKGARKAKKGARKAAKKATRKGAKKRAPKRRT